MTGMNDRNKSQEYMTGKWMIGNDAKSQEITERCQAHCLVLPHWLKSKEAVCQATQRHHHVVSLAVIVMCHMLKCMMTSNPRIQAHTLVWSVSFLVLVMFTFCGHLVIYSDMVAEQVRTKVQKIRKTIRSMTETTTSSSGERKRFKWNLNLQEGADINMFAHDHRIPPAPQPTSFDVVKPSFLEWSEEVIAYLAVTDHHEFNPLLSAAAASKDVIKKNVMFRGILSENIENIDKVTAQKVQKEQDKVKAISANKPQNAQDITREIKDIQEEIDKLNSKLEQKKSALLKADFFLRCTLLHATSGDPNVMVRRIMRTSVSDSGAVTGLEFWRQMSVHFARSAKTKTVSLLKVCHRWSGMQRRQRMSLSSTIIGVPSKYEAISSEKISDTVKITLALQNVKGNLAQSLNVSISDSATWPQVHALLINYFNNAVPVDLKPIYQFDQSEKTEINSFKKGKGKGQKSKGQNEKDQKGPRHLRIPKESQKAEERPSQKARANGLLGHGVKISRMSSGVKVRPQADLSVRPVREDRDQLVQERQRQRSKIKRTKGKGSKGSSSFQNPKGKSKGTGKTKSKGKGQWTTWSWGQNQQNVNWGQGQKGQKGSKSGKGKSACSICGKSGHAANQCWWNRDQEGWNSQGSAPQLKGSSGSQCSKEVYNIHQYPQDQPIQTLPPDQLRGFRDLRPQAQQQQYQNLSQASTQCGSIATVLSSSNQGGFSGQRLNINYLSESGDPDSGIMGQEICASFPYSIGSGLPHHLQEPWAALLDSRCSHINCTVVIRTSCTHHTS